MIAELAKDFHAAHRGNCAMSIAYAYAVSQGNSEDYALNVAESYRACGGGQAKDGVCGALYTAIQMKPEFKEAIERIFKDGAKNCTLCKEIRPNKIIPCNRCVELAGMALDSKLA